MHADGRKVENRSDQPARCTAFASRHFVARVAEALIIRALWGSLYLLNRSLATMAMFHPEGDGASGQSALLKALGAPLTAFPGAVGEDARRRAAGEWAGHGAAAHNKRRKIANAPPTAMIGPAGDNARMKRAGLHLAYLNGVTGGNERLRLLSLHHLLPGREGERARERLQDPAFPVLAVRHKCT